MQNSEFRVQRCLGSSFLCILHSAFFISALAACDRPASTSAEFADVSLPDLTRVDAPVQAQIRGKHAALTQLIASRASSRDLGLALGEYAMLLHAAEFQDAARPAYVHAQALQPDDVRWPYYLGHLYRDRGDPERAMQAFQRALELQPDMVPALIWFGRMSLDHGDADQAEAMFVRAQLLMPQAVAARVGLGQVALARKDYRKAVDAFEEALSTDPSVASVYAPLAVAYRGLGQTAKAESLQHQWRNTGVPVPDPYRLELDTVLESALSYELRGVRALDQRDFATAERLFRNGLSLSTPDSQLSRSLRHKLGTALALSGDVDRAVQEFEATVGGAPAGSIDEPAAKASYSLGVLSASVGDEAAAMRRLEEALRFNPNYFEAHLLLADVLRAGGRFADARRHYEQSLRLNPRSAPARDGLALALGRRRT